MTSDTNGKNDISTDLDSGAVGKSSKRKIHLKIFLITVLILLAGLFIALGYRTLNNTAKACSDRSEGSILSRAKVIFRTQDGVAQQEQLTELVSDISKLDNYAEDANCLYPIIHRHIAMGNGEEADKLLGQFEAAYGDGKDFANDIYPKTDIASLRSLIDFTLKYESKVNRQGSGNISDPAPIQENSE